MRGAAEVRACVVGAACGGADVRSCVYHVSVFVVHLSSLSKDTLCVPVAGRKFERSLLINLIPAELLHLQPFRRGRLASLPRHRRARRVLAMAWWARGGVAGCTRRQRRAFFADSTTSPNRPATLQRLRPGSAVSAVVRQRGGLSRSSSAPRLA